MTPEGTRHAATQLKTGFYRIACGANVPIVMFALDYQNKTIHCLGSFQTTGNYEHDLPKILDYYNNKISAKHPQRLAKPLQKND